MLPSEDQAYLDERFPGNSVTGEGGLICVVLPNFPLPAGFTLTAADLLLRLPPGYPDAPPDMWWFEPFIVRAGGGEIPQTNSHETYLGRVWQRWSRHLPPGSWRPGLDSIESYLSLVRTELAKAARPLAA